MAIFTSQIEFFLWKLLTEIHNIMCMSWKLRCMDSKMLLQKVIQLNVPLVVGSVNQQAIGHTQRKILLGS